MARTPEDTTNISAQCCKRINELIKEYASDKKSFASLVGLNQGVIIRATKYSIIPSVKSLMKIADALNLPIAYVSSESDNPEFEPSLHRSTFHKRLKELSEESGNSYADISNIMPFAPNSIYEWRRKNCLPSLDYLKALADYFKVSLDYLLGRTDYKN